MNASNDAVKSTVAAFTSRDHQLFINGEWRPAVSGETLTTENPATGQVISRFAAGARADVELAVKAARKAFDSGAWPAMPPTGRARLLHKLADAIESHADELALLESLDNGMSLFSARLFNIGGAAENLRYNAGWATKIGGETTAIGMPGEWHTYTLREPIGVVGAIVPWNVPFVMAVSKIAAALAVGCTVVLKPAEQTPLSALRLAELISEAGFPPGVFNLVTGLGCDAGAALVAHPEVDKISFTGSTPVGKSILAAAGGNLKRVALELGGKSPVFVFADADLDKAIEAAARGIFSNAGQVCAAGSRLFVHKKVFDKVVTGVCEFANKIRVAEGTSPNCDMGPLISLRQQQRVLSYIASGKEQGAEVLTGGHAIERPGYFVAPTVLANTTSDMTVVREEIFGPVVCAMPFDDDAVDILAAYANDTEYGLSSSIWTRDISTAHRLAKRIKAGTVRINAPGIIDPAVPFGGYKQSGWGSENGRVGVEAYTEIKSVIVGL
jgi:phenylacetaldehyde dehydrogenase